MAQNLNIDSQLDSKIDTLIAQKVKPSSEFYSIFSKLEILELIDALEVRREIPLKYSYKGRGAKIWDKFYIKYILPNWYRTSNVEINLLKDNFKYLNGNPQNCNKVNVIDVGAGNSHPVKAFIRKLHQDGKINRYVALDISEGLLQVSKNNFSKWFPKIEFISDTIDIENNPIPKSFLENQSDTIANIILHLGVTIANHQNRAKVFANFRDSMGKNDFLVFTCENGSSSKWDGNARGGCKYHADRVFEWIQSNIGIQPGDCTLVRKYDLERDSIVANMKLHCDRTIHFSYMGIDKDVEIKAGEEITIWRHHKFEIPQLLKEVEESGLQMVHYSMNKYCSHIMMICKIA